MDDHLPATILNVNDDEPNRYAISHMLRRAGFKITEAITGAEALHLAAANPDLILLDIQLPDLDGFEVCRRLKADAATAAIPILHLSASFNRWEDRVHGLDAGADGYLTVPIQPAELVATVRTHLRLRRREEQLRQADRQKDEFLAVLAHELRNPLAPIVAALALLAHEDAPPDVAARARDVVGRQVRQMARMVDDLLDVSRIGRGTVRLQRELVELHAVVERAIEAVRPQLEARGHRLLVSLPSRPVLLHADPGRLQQVLCNLLGNAAKYTEPGGKITLIAERHAGQVALTVEDTGRGIEPSFLPRVFAPFAQEERSLERAAGGLGIGLTLVKSLIELHGGSAEAHSEGPGRGSTFVVRLPAAEAVVRPEGTAVTAVAGAAPGRRILVVDDNVDAVDMLAVMLRLQGHDVRVAYDGPGALAAAAVYRPEVALLDLGLPGLDGWEVARRLKALPGLERAILVALTGYGRDVDRQRCREAGFRHHLLKPLIPGALEAILAEPLPAEGDPVMAG